MALSANLEASFGDGGFSLDATLNVSAGDLGSVAIDASGIDLEAITGLVDSVASGDASGIGDVVTEILSQLADVLGDVPIVGDVLEPLTAALELAQQLGGSGLTDAIGAIDGATTEDLLSGLPALENRFAAVAALQNNPSIQSLLDLLSPLLGDGALDLDGTVTDVGKYLIAIKELINLVGGLMTVESASLDLRRLTELATGMLVPSDLEAALAGVVRFKDSALDDLLVGIDPNDTQLVELISGPILAYTLAMQRLAAVITRGMAFGEATLAEANIEGLAGRVDTGSAMLREEGLSAIRGFAEEIAGWVQPVLDIELPDAQESLDAFAGQIVGVVGDLAGAIDQLDPALLSGPVTAAFDDALNVFDQIAAAAEQVTTLLSSALATVRDLVQSIDLGPVLDVIKQVIEPIATALAAVEALVSGAQAGIVETSEQAIAALTTVKDSLGVAADAIGVAFERIDDAVTALGLDSLQSTLEGVIDPVAKVLSAAQLAPYFDAANDVIGTAADVLDKVPFSILPDDVLEDLAEAVEPVKAIDFQRDVADILKDRLGEIVDSLNTDVLDAIEEAYQQVITFLDSIDPNVALQAFETDVFNPMIEAVRSIDLEAILKPLEDALAPIQDAIGDFDPISEIIEPIDMLLAEVVTQVEAFNPATLIEPLEVQVNELRTTISETLMIEQWSEWLDTAEEVTKEGLGRLDITPFVGALDGAFDGLIDEVQTGAGGPSALGTVVASLLESSGLNIRANSFGTIASWIGGVDGATQVSERLAAAASAIDALVASVEAVDLQSLIADLQPMHRSLTTTLQAHPEDSVLRLRLDVELSVAAPQELLGPLVESHTRYVAALRNAAVALRRLAASGRSEITAISTGLREALRPLQAIVDRVRALLARIGLDPEGKSIRDIIAELLQTFRPSVLLTPLTATVDVLRTKLESIAVDGFIGPVREAVASLQAVLDAIDISFIRLELSATHAEIIDLINSFSPTELLGDVLTEFEDLQEALTDFDPLGPVRDVVDAMTAIIDEVDTTFRPTVLFAPISELYQRIVDALGALNVRDLLEPVLDALDVIELQLGEGLDETATALARLQASLPDADDLGGGGASGSVSVSVGIG